MGGIGSGGWNKKYAGTVEGTIRLDSFRLNRQGMLSHHKTHVITWSINGLLQLELSLRAKDGCLSLYDATAEGSPYPDPFRQSIKLHDQTRNVGGKATFFSCPKCDAQKQHLYLTGYRFICRKCAGLTYRVQRERTVDRAFRRWDKVSTQLGGVSWEGWCGLKRPKGMHWRSYDALCEQLRAEEAIVNRSIGLLC